MTTIKGHKMAKMFIDGEEVPIERFTYEEKLYAEAVVHELKPMKYEASATITLRGGAMQDFLDALDLKPKGASDATLAKRMRYGGRKGRSAWRRLRAKGFVGTMVINDMPPMPMPPFRIQLNRPHLAGGKSLILAEEARAQLLAHSEKAAALAIRGGGGGGHWKTGVSASPALTFDAYVPKLLRTFILPPAPRPHDEWIRKNRIPHCGFVKCPRCGLESPCCDHLEVDIGIGVQTGEHEYCCPTHGLFGFNSEGVIFRDES